MHKRCKKRKYMGRLHGGMETCDYILKTGHARGCEPGEKCDKYESKNRRGRPCREQK